MRRLAVLQIAPNEEIDAETGSDDPIFCAACRHLVTRGRWSIDMGGHERVFINPAGRVFRIRCFDDAPGVENIGTPTLEHTWFPGYAWTFAHCRGCTRHIGWCFVGDKAPHEFYGLIKSALTTNPNVGQN